VLDHDRQADPALQGRRGGLEGAGQPVLLEIARPELEDQRPHLGEGFALELAELGQLRPPHRRRGRGASRPERETRVIEKSAWRHRVGSSRARWAPFPAGGELAGLAPEVAFEAVAVADIPAAPCAPDEAAAIEHADAV
jgi:hypothetical protein